MPSPRLDTIEDILATATVDPTFSAALQASQLQAGSNYTLSGIKQSAAAGLGPLQKRLADSRPSEITETEHSIRLRDDWPCRIIVCHLTADLKAAGPARPLILLLHGGGHTIGYPELQLSLARELVLAHSAVVVCASYRLAPEFPFPFSICDSWEVLQFCATENRKSNSAIFPRCTDARVGFLVGGESAGANLAASLAHLARDHNLNPPLTGQVLMAGTYISPGRVPERYQPRYLSREQNAHAPILDRHLLTLLTEAFQPDPASKLCYPFDQHDPRDVDGKGTDTGHQRGSVKHGHLGLAPAYFQVCGLDPARDDGLIYEKVLREECDVPTRLDLYSGWAHCWWAMFPDLDMSTRRMRDVVEGVGWLLGLKRDRKGGGGGGGVV
ncbi:putative lipase/esterase [Fonsecaea pedrosoi]|nr:putative lipase/esterase [Fonsecaea pedrosoi]